MNKRFSHAACVLPVSDIRDAIDFYVDKLGFEVIFSWNQPIDYAILKREVVEIHLTLKEGYRTGAFRHSSLYIYVNDIEVLHQEFVSKGVIFDRVLKEQEYGMSDFDIIAPGGHIITFGETITA